MEDAACEKRNERTKEANERKGTRDKWKGLGPNDDSRPPLEWNGMEKDRKRKKKEKKEKKQRLFLFFVAKKYFQRMKLILVVY